MAIQRISGTELLRSVEDHTELGGRAGLLHHAVMREITYVRWLAVLISDRSHMPQLLILEHEVVIEAPELSIGRELPSHRVQETSCRISSAGHVRKHGCHRQSHGVSSAGIT